MLPELCLNCDEGLCGSDDPWTACRCVDCPRCARLTKELAEFERVALEKWFGVATPTQYINPTGGTK